MITAEDMTNLENRGIIEDCGLEYHQWLEEAHVEDLPDDLELVIFFDNPQTKTPIGTFMSHEKEVKFTCCPPEDSSAASSYLVPRFSTTFCSHCLILVLMTMTHLWSLTCIQSNPSGWHRNRIQCTMLDPTPKKRVPSLQL